MSPESKQIRICRIAFRVKNPSTHLTSEWAILVDSLAEILFSNWIRCALVHGFSSMIVFWTLIVMLVYHSIERWCYASFSLAFCLIAQRKAVHTRTMHVWQSHTSVGFTRLMLFFTISSPHCITSDKKTRAGYIGKYSIDVNWPMIIGAKNIVHRNRK